MKYFRTLNYTNVGKKIVAYDSGNYRYVFS